MSAPTRASPSLASSPLFTSASQQQVAAANKPATSRHLHLHVQSHMATTAHTVLNGQVDLTPIAWDAYFDQRRMVDVPRPPPAQPDDSSKEPTTTTSSQSTGGGTDEFCVYTAQPASFATMAQLPFVVLLIHGGGHTSLAWACVAGLLKSSMSVLSFDLRGHGHTRTSSDGDLSLARLVDDTVAVVHARLGLKPPPLLVIGHSLGAAIGVHVTASKRLPVAALVVVDLVEGTAVDSLDHMTAVIQSRPTHFARREDAVQWSLMAGAMRNAESARCSVPDQLVQMEEGEAAGGPTDAAGVPTSSYRWRTDLLASQPFWSGWFTGLSSLFLSCPLPKLLLLAGSDRLDTPMMIAHMQGKMQLEVMANAGHSLQEDQPRETARKIAEFVQRHKLYSMGAAWAHADAKGTPTAPKAPTPANPTSAGPTPSTESKPARPHVPVFHE